MKIPRIAQRTQLIKGVTYVYEDYLYWDAQKKQTRYKCVYIGKQDDKEIFIPNKRYLERQALSASMNPIRSPWLLPRQSEPMRA